MALSSAELIAAVVFAGLLGVIIGSFLNVVVVRVPAGVPLTRESRCPHCDTRVRASRNVPVVSWIALRGRCESCGAPISARYPMVEAGTGLAFAAVTWIFLTASRDSAEGGWESGFVIAAYLYFAAISIALALIDTDTHRLPNAIVLPGYVVATGLLAVAAVLGGTADALLRAVLGAAGLYAFYFVLRLIRPGGMGGGDVKLAGLVGLYLAWLGWGALIVGSFAAFVLGGLFGIFLLALRKAGRKTAIPFGPFMLVGAWVGIVSGEALARWYTGQFVIV